MLCGRNAVQLSHAGARISLDELAEKLKGVGQLTRNQFLLRLEVEGYELTIFPDARAIISGTDDMTTARAFTQSTSAIEAEHIEWRRSHGNNCRYSRRRMLREFCAGRICFQETGGGRRPEGNFIMWQAETVSTILSCPASTIALGIEKIDLEKRFLPVDVAGVLDSADTGDDDARTSSLPNSIFDSTM